MGAVEVLRMEILEEIKGLRDDLIEEYEWDKYTATFHAFRAEVLRKIGFSKILDKVYEHYYKQISKETDLEKLSIIKNRGITEVGISYLLLFGSIISSYYNSNLIFGIVPSLYLNWRGECEYLAIKQVTEQRVK